MNKNTIIMDIRFLESFKFNKFKFGEEKNKFIN